MRGWQLIYCFWSDGETPKNNRTDTYVMGMVLLVTTHKFWRKDIETVRKGFCRTPSMGGHCKTCYETLLPML